MGVCTGERPVMHWQSAGYHGPSVREKCPLPLLNQDISQSKSKHFKYCSTCPEICNHSTKIFDSPYKQFCSDAEHAISEESSKKYQQTKLSESEVSEEVNSDVILKTEPFGPPSSPESTHETYLSYSTDDCAGCGRLIQDRFYLSAVEKRWHINCLQCHACGQLLDQESTCYARDGNIFCKNDYFSFFGTRRCSRCLASISSTELVMRARNLVFHINCFCCAVCLKPLTKGDQYGIIDSLIYCRTHYCIARERDALSSAYSSSAQFGSPQTNSSPHSDTSRIVPSGSYVSSSHLPPGIAQPPRQKGRPRKRKPKDIDSLTINIDLNTEYLDYGRGSHLGASSRTKRMRTSFKHHQLRTMKSYFALNHNPDAKDLKQLSQKTGLPKRVLQVWFQNARAKWRRMMMKQDGSNTLGKGDGSLDLDSISAQSPTSFILLDAKNSSPHSLD